MKTERKSDHIELAQKAQLSSEFMNKNFYYEPLFGTHPKESEFVSTSFLGHQLNFPLWISSMTGGTAKAKVINKNLATVAAKFRIGMGLGSCRPLLTSIANFDDFNLRPILGPDLPFFANIGIFQLQELINQNDVGKLHRLVEKLKATGIIIHINPLQEWFQPEGDKIIISPFETLSQFLEIHFKNRPYKVIVKEVGQGMGPKSLKALIDLKVDAIELAGFGGTNFSRLEVLRQTDRLINLSSSQFLNVGHTAYQMVGYINHMVEVAPQKIDTEIIISGGINNLLEGIALRKKLKINGIIGRASDYLRYAENFDLCEKYFRDEVESLKLAEQYLNFNQEESR
jgi:isopentenyl-diphosphate delta-isomerase